MSGWWKLGATAVAAVAVAEGAAWLLSPTDVIDPVSVDPGEFLDQARVDEAVDFRSGQRWLFLGGVAAQGAVLGALIAGRPRRARELLERAADRPVLGGAAAAAGLSVALTVTTLPFDAWSHERAVDVGLSTQDLGAWFSDWGKSNAIGALLAGAIGTGALALIRHSPKRWWIPGSAAVVAIGVVFSWLAPVVLAPLFNDFEPLEPGKARSDVLELGEKADVEIGEVYSVDASRRSTALNAYVGGLGPTKRVVLYDNLIDQSDDGELRSVVAHELAHVSENDIPRGILFVALAAPLAVLFVARSSEALARRGGAEPGTPASLPALAVTVAVASFVIGVAGNQLSRAVERKADTVALELTDDPRALIELQQRLSEANLSDPDPPAITRFLLGTHPTTTERIGAAKAWEEGQRP